MSIADDTIDQLAGMTSDESWRATNYPWFEVSQRPLEGPGSVTTWFKTRKAAQAHADTLSGRVRIDGRTWDEWATEWNVARLCAVCGGKLIRSELEHGTCWHCGGRSVRNRRS